MPSGLFHHRREERHEREVSLQPHPGSCVIAAVGHDVHANPVLRTSVDLATRLHAHLHVVHVIDLSDYPADPDSAAWEEQAQEELRHREALVAEELSNSPVAWSYATRHGVAPGVLCELAEAHEPVMVIVPAGHGLGGARDRLTLSSLIHHCRRPVLVVPPAVSSGAS